MSDDRIPLNPLDEGDQFVVDVQPGDDEDTVTLTVKTRPGAGYTTAYALHRWLTETPELRAERQEADHLALLKEPS